MFAEIRKRSTRQWEPVDTAAAAARQAEVDAYCALLEHSVRTAWVRRRVACGPPRLGNRPADGVAYALNALRAAQNYTLWCDAENFAAVACPLAGKSLPFPLDRIVPRLQRRDVTEELHSGRVVLDRDTVRGQLRRCSRRDAARRC